MHGLAADPRAAIAGRSPQELYATGLPICQALKADPVATRVFMLAELTRIWKAVKVGDAKTWTDQDSLQDAVDDVLEIFPTLKLEEYLHALKLIRQGSVKIWGRLDTPTLLEALRDYESRHTITYRTQQNQQRPSLVETAALEGAHRPGTLDLGTALRRVSKELPRPRKTLEELGGHLHLTAEDLQQIEDHQKQQPPTP